MMTHKLSIFLFFHRIQEWERDEKIDGESIWLHLTKTIDEN